MEVWITSRSCSECFRRHDETDFPESYDEDCDCWCHERDEPNGEGWDW